MRVLSERAVHVHKRRKKREPGTREASNDAMYISGFTAVIPWCRRTDPQTTPAGVARAGNFILVAKLYGEAGE